MMDRIAEALIRRVTKFAEHRRFQDQCGTEKNIQGNWDRPSAVSTECSQAGIRLVYEPKCTHA